MGDGCGMSLYCPRDTARFLGEGRMLLCSSADIFCTLVGPGSGCWLFLVVVDELYK